MSDVRTRDLQQEAATFLRAQCGTVGRPGMWVSGHHLDRQFL